MDTKPTSFVAAFALLAAATLPSCAGFVASNFVTSLKHADMLTEMEERLFRIERRHLSSTEWGSRLANARENTVVVDLSECSVTRPRSAPPNVPGSDLVVWLVPDDSEWTSTLVVGALAGSDQHRDRLASLIPQARFEGLEILAHFDRVPDGDYTLVGTWRDDENQRAYLHGHVAVSNSSVSEARFESTTLGSIQEAVVAP